MTAVTVDRLAALGLLEGAPTALPEGPAWDALWRDVVTERAVALVAAAADRGLVLAAADQDAAIVAAHEDRMRACLTLERVTLDVVGRLDSAGIAVRVLKGPANAYLDYPDPAWRSFGDVDVLVRSDQYEDALDVLRADGSRRRSAEVRPGFDRRFGKGVCLIRPDGVQIDVHRTLASGPFGLTIDLEDLWSEPEWFLLGGVEVAALSRELRLLHACFHAVLGDSPARITALRDVVQIAASPGLDVPGVVERARRWGARVVVAEAVQIAAARLGPVLPAELAGWARTYRPSRSERRALAAYTGPGRSYARQMVAAVPAIRGFRAKASYLRALVFVDADYARRHDGGRRGRIGRALRARPGAPT